MPWNVAALNQQFLSKMKRQRNGIFTGFFRTVEQATQF